MSPRIPKSLKLSLRGSVEIQAQQAEDRVGWDRSDRPRTESVGTDRIRPLLSYQTVDTLFQVYPFTFGRSFLSARICMPLWLM